MPWGTEGQGAPVCIPGQAVPLWHLQVTVLICPQESLAGLQWVPQVGVHPLNVSPPVTLPRGDVPGYADGLTLVLYGMG